MELHLIPRFSTPLFPNPKNPVFIEPSSSSSISIPLSNTRSQRLRSSRVITFLRIPSSAGATMTLEQPGGKMVVELVGAFNELTERMSHSSVLSSSSSRLLFKALKLSIPILHSLPLLPDGRSPLSKALSLALTLADLQVNPLPLRPRPSVSLALALAYYS